MDVQVSTSLSYDWPLNVGIAVKACVELDTSVITVLFPGAPKKVGAGFEVGGSGEANLTTEGYLENNLDGKLLNAGAAGLLRVNGNGGLHGGAYGRVDDHIYGTYGEIHGKGGLLGKSVFIGELGLDKNGVMLSSGTNRLTGASDYGAGASGSIHIDEDAKPQR